MFTHSKKIQLFAVFALFILSGISVLYGQTTFYSAPASFILIPPSASSQAMGGCGVANPTDDAFNSHYNPGILGLSSLETNFLINFYPKNQDYIIYSPDQYYNNFAISAGYNLSNELKGIFYPKSIGIGFIRQYINFGEFISTDGSGKILGKLKSEESANTFSLSASFDFWIKLGIGLSLKSINILSEITDDNNIKKIEDNSAFAYDFGLIAVAPILNKLKISDLTTDFNVSLGYSIANVGDKLKYSEVEYPLPRIGRLGYGLNLVLNYPVLGNEIKILDANWTAEAYNHLYYSNINSSGYKSGLLDLNPWENIIKVNSTNGAVSQYGWKFNLFEILSICGGYSEYKINSNLSEKTSSGYIIQSKGITKILDGIIDNSILKFISKHINIRYSNAEIEQTLSEQYILLSELKHEYQGIELIVYGFIF
jgi:hypothetical protein